MKIKNQDSNRSTLANYCLSPPRLAGQVRPDAPVATPQFSSVQEDEPLLRGKERQRLL
ncbi:Hypothetical protein SMAX5B_016800 [Scophthalmus maximus]|uniref:Uncharacterized protein n=1 Tax=Scophthalmus maximus TaxID=52904 RepID=A0A2U9CDL1_SCOMX|nr:Hypothetical protein SMAX5B_016800 [Scophthalmus maximus]